MSSQFLRGETSPSRMGVFGLNAVLIAAALALFIVPRIATYGEYYAAELRDARNDAKAQVIFDKIDRDQAIADRNRRLEQATR